MHYPDSFEYIGPLPLQINVKIKMQRFDYKILLYLRGIKIRNGL